MYGRTTNYWKIGLFVVAGGVLGVGTLFWIGARRLHPETVERVTYFDESVQGLDVGAPVKMRGVTMGTVKRITIAPDRRLVEVTADISVALWKRIGLGTAADLRAGQEESADLRVQLATTGITGVKFLNVDFFPSADPPPRLPFEPPYNYIPSTPSTLKSVEETFVAISRDLPGITESAQELLTLTRDKLGPIDTATLNRRLDDLLVKGDSLVARADSKLTQLDAEALNEAANALLTRLETTVRRLDELLARAETGEGPLGTTLERVRALAARGEELATTLEASVREADLPATSRALRDTVESYGALPNEAGALAVDVQRTLDLLRATLVAFEALASQLERDPGALLRGRAAERPPSASDD